jgi:quercetin dioxygenase-like cupin family protein
MTDAIARKSDESDALWLLGGLYEILVKGEETGGNATVMRFTMGPGVGSPPHTHPGDETLYVVSGEIEVNIEGEAVTAGPGSSFYFPAGTREFFTANTEATVLVTYMPGGIDKFFSEVGEPAAVRTLPPPSDDEPDFPTILSTAARYGMNIEAPPH